MRVRANDWQNGQTAPVSSSGADDFGATFFEPTRAPSDFSPKTIPQFAPGGGGSSQPQALGDDIGDTIGTAQNLAIDTTLTTLNEKTDEQMKILLELKGRR